MLHKFKLALAEFDNFLQGWKTFIFLIIAGVGFYVLPESLAKDWIAALGLIGVGVARASKKANE